MTYTIGQLARTAGVPVSTVRYYERRSLLPADGRTEANDRTYGAESLSRLRLIRAAQGLGFSLTDIGQLLDLRFAPDEAAKSESTGCCGEVQGIIEARLSMIEQRLVSLQHDRGVLAEALEWCRGSSGTERCRVLDELGRRAEAAD